MNDSTSVDSTDSIRYRLGMTAVALAAMLLVLLLPEAEGLSPAGQRLGAVAIAMALLWSTQAWPLAVTSLLPLVLFPIMQIQNAEVVSRSYMNATILLYFAGFGIAIGVERWGLHRRLALYCLAAIGTGPRRVVLAFMLGTGLLSMWISNTAATLLMLPIALAVLQTLGDSDARGSITSTGQAAVARTNRLAVALLLGIAYSASIGGMCTLIGTPTNGVYAGYWTAPGMDPELTARYGVSSGQWLLMFAPISAALMFVCWVILCWPLRHDGHLPTAARQEIARRKAQLGAMGSGERRMFGVFCAIALLWLTRVSIDIGPFVIPGWETAIDQVLVHLWPGHSYQGWLHDSTAGLLMLTLMFLIPARDEATGRTEFLIDWPTIEAKTPWGVLLLFGGGFALASACTTTGLSGWLGAILGDSLANVSDVAKIFGVTGLVIFLTEFTSNTATIATLLPILDQTARALAVDPRLLMLPATIAASCAFMLPIATPPNAIVFSSNRLKVSQMLYYGTLVNLAGIGIITGLTWTWVLQFQQGG